VLFELIKLALQSAAGLLAHRTAARLMQASAPKVRRCDEWIARLAGVDGDLHDVLSSVAGDKVRRQKLKRPGAVTQPGPFDV
jgi:hypothetical protein